MLLNATKTTELDLETEEERDLEVERQHKIRDGLIAACRAVVTEVGGYDKAAAALQVIWGPCGRHVDGDKLRATLSRSSTINRQNFRLEWVLWFATQSEEVRELLAEVIGHGKPKKKPEDELRDLKREMRSELGKTAEKLIRKAENS